MKPLAFSDQQLGIVIDFCAAMPHHARRRFINRLAQRLAPLGETMTVGDVFEQCVQTVRAMNLTCEVTTDDHELQHQEAT
jgi:hypothetical protein